MVNNLACWDIYGMKRRDMNVRLYVLLRTKVNQNRCLPSKHYSTVVAGLLNVYVIIDDTGNLVLDDFL